MWAIRLPRCSTAHRVCTANAAVSCGVISYTPTQIIYEGDLDGSGTVYRVYVQLQPGTGGTCPCTLQRGAVRKSDALAGTVPTYFTEVNGVLNSGNGLGGATYAISLPGPGSYTSYGTADVFDAYDVAGGAVGTCTTISACSSIHSVQITANIAPNYGDARQQDIPGLFDHFESQDEQQQPCYLRRCTCQKRIIETNAELLCLWRSSLCCC